MNQLKKKRKSRLGGELFIQENAVKKRREREIDLSKYNIGFEAVTNSKVRPPQPNQNGQYDKYQAKLSSGQLSKFSTRDIMYFFRDTANDNGAKYIISNPKIDMRNFKLALERGYSTEDVLAMIEFLFTSEQNYLDTNRLHPGILLTNWCNTIYNDTQLWLEDKYVPKSKHTLVAREWQDNDTDIKSNVGEW